MDPSEVVVTISIPHGIHLRSGKEIVRLARQYQATIAARNLTRESPTVDAKSILQLMQLQARPGHQILITAVGSDASDAVDALRVLLEQLAE